MHYTETAQSGNSYSHMWDVASMKTLDGGFLFDKATIPAGTEKLPKGVFLKADLTNRKASLVKTAKLAAAVLVTDTEVKLEKGHMLLATDKIGTGSTSVTVGTLDTSDEDYDVMTIVANSLGAIAIGDVLQQFDASGIVNPDGLNPFEVELDAQPSCSVMFRADGIVVSRLPQPVTAAIDAALVNCQFLNV